MEMPTLAPVAAAAAQLGISQRTVQRWMKDGAIRRYRKAGDRRTYVDVAELRRFTEFREA